MSPRSITRRAWLRGAGVSLASAPYLSGTVIDLSPTAFMGHAQAGQGWGGVVLQASEGESLITGRRRARLSIKVDSARVAALPMSMVVSEVDPGATIPVHRHTYEDELIFIHTGEGVVTLGEREVAVTAGAMLYGPRAIWHGVRNTGSVILTWCAIYSPAGFEQFFKETGSAPATSAPAPTPAQLAAAAVKYGLVFRDP